MALEVGLRISTFFSPDDPCQDVLLDFVCQTQQHLRVAMYGLHLPPLIDALLALHAAGKDVALVLDHTQAAGHAEKPEVQALLAAGVPLRIGTSQKHAILHHKFFVRDKSAVLAGSYNASLGAAKEANYFDVVDNADRATLFLAKWQELWDFISAHEAVYQHG